jgi:hypothetical protein
MILELRQIGSSPLFSHWSIMLCYLGHSLHGSSLLGSSHWLMKHELFEIGSSPFFSHWTIKLCLHGHFLHVSSHWLMILKLCQISAVIGR